MNQTDKENTIRNSKLQMSIKPFTTVREDLAKSKSVDKTRKGITRINSLAPSQPLVQPPLSHNYNHQTQKPNWQSQPTQPQSAQSNYSFQANLTPNTIPMPSSQKGPYFPYNQQPPQIAPVIQHSDELYKMEMLQKQITVLERQNIQIAAQRSEWKDKCKQLFQANEQGMGKIKQLQEQVLFMQKSLDDRQLFLKEKQKYTKQLVQASRIDKLKIAQIEQRCRKLVQRVQQKAQKLEQKQEQIRRITMKPKETRYDQKYWEQKYRGVTQEYKRLEEEHRKLLIKSSASFQQKQLLETKIRSLTFQFQQEFDSNRQLTQQLRQLQFQVEQLEEDALFGRACRKQLQQLSHLRSANTELEQLKQELEYRVRDLENRRLNQIQFHQEQIKRIINSESSKYETIIRVYKQQRDKAVQEKQNLKTHYESTIENIHKDYLIIVNQMKEEIVSIKASAMDKAINQDQRQRQRQRELERSRNRQRQKQRELQRERSREKERDRDRQRQRMKQRQRQQDIKLLQQKYSKILYQKQQQINTLLQKLEQITEDNKFIFQRLQQKKSKQNQSIPSSNNHQIPSSCEYYSFESELQKLQSNNIGLSQKLSNYEIELMKLGDKIQMYQIQIEKYKNKEEASQRKIRHYIEEMEYVEKGREKQIQDKVKCVQQLNQLKLQLKSKTSQQKHQHDKLQLQSEQLTQQQTQINLHIVQIEQQQKIIRQITQQLQRQKEQNNKLQQTYRAYQDVKNTLDIVNIELSKFQQCYKLAKEECQILREKERVREERRKGDEERKKGEEDKGRGTRWNQYSDIAVILGVDIQSTDESALLLSFTKSIKSILEERKDDRIRIQKMQAQYKQLLETQNATRLLAQKYQQKCLQLQRLLIRMQEAHKDKLILVKQDYDIVYSKYLKYRNIVVTHNNGVKERSRSREKDRSRDKDKERDILYKQTVLKDKQRQKDREREREKRDKIARR